MSDAEVHIGTISNMYGVRWTVERLGNACPDRSETAEQTPTAEHSLFLCVSTRKTVICFASVLAVAYGRSADPRVYMINKNDEDHL